MKRFRIPAIIIVGLVTLCLGQSRSRITSLKIIQLSEPSLQGTMSLEQALARRRSIRQFTDQQLKPTHISQLAWAGQGITDPQRGLRTAPSAGETYPIKLYISTQAGVFVYRPQEHSLEQISNLDVRSNISGINAPCAIIIAGSERQVMTKFRREAREYMLLEAGHIAQSIHLQAVCLDLGTVPIGGFDERSIRKVCRFSKDLEPLLVIAVGYPGTEKTTEQNQGAGETEPPGTKKAVLIVGRENFRDEELFETMRVLNETGVKTIIASSRLGIVRGMLGNLAEATILVKDVVVDDYDAIVFIGGAGAMEYFESRIAWRVSREALQKKKILGAICIAPVILANAGLLKDVRVTSFPTERDRLIGAGAFHTGVPVERDGLIITGDGPLAAILFGAAIAEALAGR